LAEPSLNVTFSLDGHAVHLGRGLLKGAIARGDLTAETPVLIEQGGVEVYAGPAGASGVLAGLFPEPAAEQEADESEAPGREAPGLDAPGAEPLEAETQVDAVAVDMPPEEVEPQPPEPLARKPAAPPLVPLSPAPSHSARPSSSVRSPDVVREGPGADPGGSPVAGRLFMLAGLLVLAFLVSRCFVGHDRKPAAEPAPAVSDAPAKTVQRRARTKAEPPALAGQAPATERPSPEPRAAEASRAVGPDCAKTRAWAEAMICRTPALADADQELEEVYRRLGERLSEPARTLLIREQRRWALGREQCRRAPEGDACLLDMIGRRTQALQGRMTAEEEPALEEPPPPPADAPRQLRALVWDKAPSLDVAYPPGAADLDGRVRMRCEVLADLKVSCVVTEETPEGRGFGRAALSIFKRARLKPAQEGSAVKPGDWFSYAVSFKPSG